MSLIKSKPRLGGVHQIRLTGAFGQGFDLLSNGNGLPKLAIFRVGSRQGMKIPQISAASESARMLGQRDCLCPAAHGAIRMSRAEPGKVIEHLRPVRVQPEYGLVFFDRFPDSALAMKIIGELLAGGGVGGHDA